MSLNQNKYCNHCGALLDEESQFCEECGKPVAAPASSQIHEGKEILQRTSAQEVFPPHASLQKAASPVRSQANGSGKPASMKKGVACLLVGLVMLLGFLCLVVLGVGGYFLYMKSSSVSSGVAMPASKPGLPTEIAPPEVDTAKPDCPGAAQPRLQKGDHVQVIIFDPMVIYKQPLADETDEGEKVAEVPLGTRLIVLDGPVCSYKINWWLVEFGEGGQSGWAPEANRRGVYWLEKVSSSLLNMNP